MDFNQYNLLLDQAREIWLVYDMEGKLRYANKAFEQNTGYTAADLKSRELYKMIHEEDLDRVRQRIREVYVGTQIEDLEFRYVDAKGELRWAGGYWKPLYDENGVQIGIMGQIVEVTTKKLMETQLRKGQDNFNSLFDANIIGVSLSDWEGRTTLANDALLDMLGYSREDFLAGRIKWTEMTPKEYIYQDKLMTEEIAKWGKCRPIEKEYIRKDGSRVQVMVGVVKLRGDENHFLSIIVDLTKQKELEKKLTFQANHDYLTGIPNRRHFIQTLNEVLYSCRHQNRYDFSLLFVDVDDFKDINDTYGHAVGDQALILLAKKLSFHVRQDDILARLGGDEFVLLLRDVQTIDEVTAVAKRLYQELDSPVVIDGFRFNIRVSVGIAFQPWGFYESHAILQVADRAMYKAKQAGKCHYFVLS